MRTTLDVDASLVASAKRRAAGEGLDLAAILERALAAFLARPPRKGKPYRFRWTAHKGKCLIDPALIDSRSRLFDLLDGLA